MNRYGITAWLAAGAAIVMAQGAQAQNARSMIEARYGEVNAAFVARDGAALAKLVTSDFSTTDIMGSPHTLAEIQERFKSPPQAEEQRTSPRIISFTLNGDKASASAQIDLKITRPGPDGSPVQLDVTVINADTWALQGGQWLLQSNAQKDVTVKKGGEVVFHQAN